MFLNSKKDSLFKWLGRHFGKKTARRFTRARLKDRAKRHGWQIGEYSYGTPKVWWWGEKATLTIGRFCSIGDDVNIYLGGDHHMNWVTTYPFITFFRDWPEAQHNHSISLSRGDVSIGNDVWIGNGATILSGVTIGDGAVIGGGALVTKHVEPYAIVGGNPARVLKMRFEPEIIRSLLDIRWWDWPIERIRLYMKLLQSGDIKGFITRVNAETT